MSWRLVAGTSQELSVSLPDAALRMRPPPSPGSRSLLQSAGATVPGKSKTETKDVGNIHGAPMQAFNRGKESVYNDALDAYKQGMDRITAQVMAEVRPLFEQTVDEIRGEFATTTADSHAKLDDKLNTVLGKVQHLISHSSAGLMDGQGEANQKSLAESLARITKQLSQVHTQLNQVQTRSDMDDMCKHLSSSLELPKVLDAQATAILEKCQNLHLESKAQADDLSQATQQIQACLQQHMPVDFKEVLGEVGKCQRMVAQDFRVLVREIGNIQRGLNLDYMQVDTGLILASCTQPGKPTPQRGGMLAATYDGDDDDTMTHSRRLREVWSQTETASHNADCQTDPELLKPQRKNKLASVKAKTTNDAKKVMADADAKQKARRKLLLKAQYDVADYYHDRGCFQAIAKSNWFEYLTILCVVLNAFWIAVDVDNNDAAVLIDAAPIFQIMENVFCFYFFVEIFIRFMAFARKRHAFQDRWFIFDFILVFNMVIETWIIPVVMLGTGMKNLENTVDISMLRIFRLVKLLRLSRISRLLRAVPELVIIVKAITFATRSVAIFFVLWLVIIFLFGIVFRQLTDGTAVGGQYFSSVPGAMNTLLLNGLLADYEPIVNGVGGEKPHLYVVMLMFVLLASVTVMYMLVGVLVEVVGKISAAEKEDMTVTYVAGRMRRKMESLGQSTEDSMPKEQLESLLLDPDVVQLLASVNVDVIVLMDTLDMAYEDLSKQGGSMTFEKMINTILTGRGANTATVRDMKEVVRITKSLVKTTVGEVYKKVSKEFDVVHARLKEMRDEALAHQGLVAGEDADSEDEHGEHGAKVSDDPIPSPLALASEEAEDAEVEVASIKST